MKTEPLAHNLKTGLNAYTISRIVLGSLFLLNAPIAFFVSPQQMGLNPEATRTLQSLWDTGYLMQQGFLIKMAGSQQSYLCG